MIDERAIHIDFLHLDGKYYEIFRGLENIELLFGILVII